MKTILEFVKKYWKVVAIGIGTLIVAFFLFKLVYGVYLNTYYHEKYQYLSKSFQNEILDQNVIIKKDMKRNGTQGEIYIKFDKKEINEEYQISLLKGIIPSNAEVSVEGKINIGDMNVRLTEGNSDVFIRTVKGQNIKEVSTQNVKSSNYKLIITSNSAQGGELVIKYKFR